MNRELVQRGIAKGDGMHPGHIAVTITFEYS